MSSSPVIIVGAGFAGAAAALRLSEHGISSIILEAQNRIGGRVQTVTLPGSYNIDFGASNVHGYQRTENPARRLAEKVGVKLHVPQPGAGIVYGADRKPISEQELARIQGEIARIMDEKTPENEHISLGQRVIKELQKVSPEAEALARMAEVGAGITLPNISARHWKTERGFAGVDALPEGGYVEIIKRAIEKSGAELRLGQEIKSVEHVDSGAKVTTVAGETAKASHIILTVPVAVLQTGRIAFTPALPESRTSLIQRTSVGLLDKFSLLYSKVWWPKQAGNFILLPSRTDGFDSSSKPADVLENTTIMVANMHALSPEQPPVLLLYLPPHAAEVLEKASDGEMTGVAHDHIVSRLGSHGAEQPLEGRMVRWKADRFALGATTSPIAFGKDAVPEDLDALGQALWDGRLGFAGEGTDRHLRGSVVGAVASGEREADRLAKLLRAI